MSIVHRTAAGPGVTAFPGVVIGISMVAILMMLCFAVLQPETAELWLAFWGFEPAAISAHLSGGFDRRAGIELAGLVSALFVHSSWLHLAGNLAYLWVFGIPVERALGHWRFLLVFLVGGALANLFVALQIAEFDRPVVGASGGVSAVIGFYLGLFPARRIGLWLPLGLFLQFARIPALLVIGSWFTLQLLYTMFGPISGAVAWWTHVAGFVAGLLVALLVRIRPGNLARAIRED